jgi:HlyD family secretion protein
VKKLLILLCLSALAGLFYMRTGRDPNDDKAAIERAAVTSGAVNQTIRAIGTLQPIQMVRVGSQVSGEVKALHADFNSVVKKDQVIAELDPTLLEVQVAVQEANIARQENDIAMQRVQLANDQRLLERDQAQFAKGLSTRQSLEKAELAVKTRKAQIMSAEKAKVQAEAQLAQAKLNVSYCTIRSPIDGVIVNRMVDVGQTLQSSVNAPTLFQIAADMTTLRLQAGVDEADIGNIRPGMPVTFSVDAYRGQTFPGRVEAVRLNAQIANSVVTYPVWIEVPNDDLRLRPNMTANLQIFVEAAENVTRIPADALQFRLTSDMYDWLHVPRPTTGRPAARLEVETEPVDSPHVDRTRREGTQIDELFAAVPKKITPGIVWVYDETNPDPLQRLQQIVVKTGVSDGRFVELVSGDLKPGMELLINVLPPPSVLRSQASLFGGPQRGFGGMQRGGPKELPTLNRGGPPRGR